MSFFDNIPHELMMKAVRKHARQAWVVLYIERWLKAPAQDEEGAQTPRTKGTPQGGESSHPCWRTFFCTTPLTTG
jgi:RNA-directed DNA polymerase